ncbi:MAG: PHP domain-containing protein [Eubacteriales bacterium]|jgi:hypothetical protein
MYTDEKGFVWYKGNIHTHTTRSDGRFDPGAVIDVYACKGYDFLVLTDHWRQSPDNESKKLLTVPGIELDYSPNVLDGIFHIVGVGMDKEVNTSKRGIGAQEMINEIRSCGGAAILAHPAWSLNTPEMILPLENICAMEIYNTVSDKPHNVRPDSSLISDMLSSRGRLIPTVSTDDAHFYDGDQCVSFIYLKTDVLDRRHIVAALEHGDFYASQGPRFSYEFSADKKSIKVRCTDAREVAFFSDAVWSGDRVFCEAKGDALPLKKVEYFFKSTESFIRFEITDFEGRKAWSSPISLSSL